MRVSRRSANVFGTPIPNRIGPPFLQTGRYMPQTKFLFTSALHAIKRVIGRAQKLFDGGAIIRINSQTGADGHRRVLSITREPLADAQSRLASLFFARLRKN